MWEGLSGDWMGEEFNAVPRISYPCTCTGSEVRERPYLRGSPEFLIERRGK